MSKRTQMGATSTFSATSNCISILWNWHWHFQLSNGLKELKLHIGIKSVGGDEGIMDAEAFGTEDKNDNIEDSAEVVNIED